MNVSLEVTFVAQTQRVLTIMAAILVHVLKLSLAMEELAQVSDVIKTS